MGKLTYIRCGDYDIPNLKLSAQPETSIGKYGRMRTGEDGRKKGSESGTST